MALDNCLGPHFRPPDGAVPIKVRVKVFRGEIWNIDSHRMRLVTRCCMFYLAELSMDPTFACFSCGLVERLFSKRRAHSADVGKENGSSFCPSVTHIYVIEVAITSPNHIPRQ